MGAEICFKIDSYPCETMTVEEYLAAVECSIPELEDGWKVARVKHGVVWLVHDPDGTFRQSDEVKRVLAIWEGEQHNE